MLTVAVVGEGVDGYSTSRGEDTFDLDLARIHKGYQVLHYDVYAVLVEIAVVAETEQVEFEAFALDHPLAWNVGDEDFSEIGLSGLRTERGKFRAGEGDYIFIVGVLVDECFKHLGGILCRVLDSGVAEQRHPVEF